MSIDTPVYVWVAAGEFTMGSTGDQINAVTEVCKRLASRCVRSWFEDEAVGDNERQHKVTSSEFWLLRTEVTNWQYGECVKAEVCEAPDNNRWDKLQLRYWPVTNVTWHQANTYAQWRGGRLPTEAEWEKACRGTDARIYPWGNEPPTPELANFGYNEGTTTDVGNYEAGQSPYGLLDIVGNVWEWTSSQFQDYPYQATDGREEQMGDAARTLRGGAFNSLELDARCALRDLDLPSNSFNSVGFRLVSPGF